jgi:uncharacterized protein
MEFEWDPQKNASNLKKHHISFKEASDIFNHPTFTSTDTRKKYGETRLVSIGQIGATIIIVVVHTRRNQKIRIISARLANHQERKAYYATLKKTRRRN